MTRRMSTKDFMARQSRQGDTIKITCYGKTEEHPEKDRKKLMRFYLDGMRNSEGSERERYTNIYMGLENGDKVIMDESRRAVIKTTKKQAMKEAKFPWEYRGDSTQSIVEALDELSDAFDKVVSLWSDNAEGVDLNDDEFIDLDMPFTKSLDEFAWEVDAWVDDVKDTIKYKTGISVESRSSRKTGKKLNETWAGEDVISDLVDRAEGWYGDDYDLEEAVTRALDDGLIYTKDIRTLADHYDVLPDDSELISLFYEELYGDVYNQLSERVEEEDEDDDIETESFSMKSLRRLDERKEFTWDKQALKGELDRIKKVFDNHGAKGLTKMPLETIKNKYPNFFLWLERYHKGMEGNDHGVLYKDSTPINDYWKFMDDIDFEALFAYIDDEGTQVPIAHYIDKADWLKPFMQDEKEVLPDDEEL